MLEGLEVKEAQFSGFNQNKDKRADSDFWIKQPQKNSKLYYEKIRDCLLISQYGISISMNEEGSGYPIYRMNEIHHMFCDFEVNKFAEITESQMQIFNLKDRDVVFNRTNSYELVGRTGIYRKLDNRDFIFASYLVRFVPDQKKILPEYLTAFLNSEYGIWEIKRRARQSINQTNVNPEEIKEIEIPLLAMKLQILIKQSFDKAFILLKKSKKFYSCAEAFLLNNLNLNNCKFNTDKTNIRSFKESFGETGRLDAEYYQRKYEEIENLIISFSGNNRLGSLIEYINTGEYAEQYLPKNNNLKFYIRSTNINKGQIEEDENYYIQPDNFTKFAKEGDILTARVGTLGIFGVVNNEMAGAIYSDNILCFKLSVDFYPDVYSLWFNSEFNFKLIDRLARGSVQRRLNQETIKELIVPIIPPSVQIKISSFIQESFALKAESERLLKVAKKAVEVAIEQGEEAAMKFINES